MGRVQVTPQVSLEPSLSINWLDLVQGSFTAKVLRTRATYTITPRMFVSGIVQYNSAGNSFGNNVRSAGSIVPAASCSSFTPTISIPTHSPTWCRCVTAPSS